MTVTIRSVQPVLMCSDVRASIAFFERLGFECVFGPSPDGNYAGVRRGDVELHLQWHDENHWRHRIDRPTYRFVVEDVDGLHSEFRESGLEVKSVFDAAWGTREFHLRDPDGNGLQFYRDR
jgi:catechol 2,3-dioxygenase-like lactoylglutathione lyase family enzyme